MEGDTEDILAKVAEMTAELEGGEDLTLRDVIMIVAMHAVVANSFADYGTEEFEVGIAEASARIADTMLEYMVEEED